MPPAPSAAHPRPTQRNSRGQADVATTLLSPSSLLLAAPNHADEPSIGVGGVRNKAAHDVVTDVRITQAECVPVHSGRLRAGAIVDHVDPDFGRVLAVNQQRHVAINLLIASDKILAR